MVATCDDSLEGLRDRALLVFAWASGGRLRSEVAAACAEQLATVDDRGCLFGLYRSKTNQDDNAKLFDKLIRRVADEALRTWLDASGISEGPIFRRLCLRSGFITEAGRRNIALGDMMAMTEHRKVDTVLGYYRTGNVSEQGVTNLLDRLPVANVTVADKPQAGCSSRVLLAAESLSHRHPLTSANTPTCSSAPNDISGEPQSILLGG